MKVAMLGWEYPPHITGGLGTACEGLTKALSRLSVSVDFVVPALIGGEIAPHMNLMGSEDVLLSYSTGPIAVGSAGSTVTPRKVPAMLAPYWGEEDFQTYLGALKKAGLDEQELSKHLPPHLAGSLRAPKGSRGKKSRYGSSIFHEVAYYASNVVSLLQHGEFSLIHAHDWMTFPAAVALKKLTGKPLVVHVHSLEFDRAGRQGNTSIRDIERLGVSEADAVVAVSHYTKQVIQREHQVPEEKVFVVHNGVYSEETKRKNKGAATEQDQKVVLFLGRVTFQKGPEYFLEAAAKVIPHVPEVLFVMAGSGDLLPKMVERVQDLGLEKNFQFTGFLRGEEVERIFSIADLYVMPSVSEPFGISALEAISNDTPVLISRQSGVSEVLRHALKVDFWDVEKMADQIINALLFDELREDMSLMAREELKKVRWDAAALKTEAIYQSLC